MGKQPYRASQTYFSRGSCDRCFDAIAVLQLYFLRFCNFCNFISLSIFPERFFPKHFSLSVFCLSVFDSPSQALAVRVEILSRIGKLIPLVQVNGLIQDAFRFQNVPLDTST